MWDSLFGFSTTYGDSVGDIHVIDTEARRALHYASYFKFRHTPFDAPFGSLDYLAAMCRPSRSMTVSLFTNHSV